MTERIWRSTRRRPIEDRLTEKIDRRGPDDCWPWRAAAATSYVDAGLLCRRFLTSDGSIDLTVRVK